MKTLILLSLLMVGCNVVSQEQSQYIEPKVIGEWCSIKDYNYCIEITLFIGLANYTNGTDVGVCMVSESIYEYNCNINKNTLIIEIIENTPSYFNRKKSISKVQK